MTTVVILFYVYDAYRILKIMCFYRTNLTAYFYKVYPMMSYQCHMTSIIESKNVINNGCCQCESAIF